MCDLFASLSRPKLSPYLNPRTLSTKMDFSSLPDDAFVTKAQFTKNVHRDEYPSINPRSTALKQACRVIVITGASQGLGRKAFAPAFTKASPKAIVLVARNHEALGHAAEELHEINPAVEVLTQAVDIRNKDAVEALYARIEADFGTVDVLVNNAGSGKSVLPIKDLDPDDFWYDFEVDVKGTLLMTQSFLGLLGPSKPGTVINVCSAAGTTVLPRTSAYALSKLVQIQMQRFVGVENPNFMAVSLHPGKVLTDMTWPAFVRFSKDGFGLAGGVAVWVATEQASFMNGRYMGVNWDVDQLAERKKEIAEKGLLMMELQGTFGLEQFEK